MLDGAKQPHNQASISSFLCTVNTGTIYSLHVGKLVKETDNIGISQKEEWIVYMQLTESSKFGITLLPPLKAQLAEQRSATGYP